MANSYDSLAKSLQEIISNRDSRKPVPYDTDGVVTRVEENTVWVKIAGSSIPETPIDRTIDAKTGDAVKVRFDNGRAWLTGNSTAPPTDDTLAQAADTKAVSAYVAAGIAQNSAISAMDSARKAQVSADDAARAADNAWGYADNANDAAAQAHTYAGQAYSRAVEAGNEAARAQTEANAARDSAQSANVSANAALLNLSTVENVLDLLQWSYEHGYYCYCASETTVVPEKVYFLLTPTRVASPTGSPDKNGYYEITGYISGTNIPILIKSTDTTVDAQKDYYTVSGVTVAEPTGSPKDNGYYELIMDDTLSDYVSGHLAMDERGLWLLPSGTPQSMTYKILISAVQGYEGITIFDNNGVAIAHYGSETSIGPEDGYHIAIRNAKLSFYNHDTEIAYINGEQLYITKTVVLDRMQLSDKWVWQYDSKDESIYLKWIGGDL